MPTPPQSPRQHQTLLLVAIVVCVAHFATFEVTTPPIITDIKFFVTFSWLIDQGMVPHLDYFDNKTQLASFVGAAFHRVSRLLGIDPLIGIRVGYLGIAATVGVWIALVHGRLAEGRVVPGLLGALAYCTFGFIGCSAATGPIPKLIVFGACFASALLVHRRRWILAGMVGALAFMDWQVGALVWLSALGTALVFGGQRRAAVIGLVAGGVVGVAPFVIYYAAHGALTEVWGQVVTASLSRGAHKLADTTVADRFDQVWKLTQLYFPHREFLVPASALGAVVGTVRLVREWRRPSARLLFPLLVFNFGVVAFSAFDFQGQGDFLLLLCPICFFLALLWAAAYDVVQRLPRPTVGTAVLLALAVMVARPSVLRPDVPLTQASFKRHTVAEIRARGGYTLQDQREVAVALSEQLPGERWAFLGKLELNYLTGRPNPLPVIYWNYPAWTHFRVSEGESHSVTLGRMFADVQPTAIIYSPPKPGEPRRNLSYTGPIAFLDNMDTRIFKSDNGRYRARVHVHRARTEGPADL